MEVAGRTLNFSKAVIATGARGVDPPVPGLAEAGYLTNETVFSLTQRPRRLLIMGGGPLGCEFAQALQRLGCRVTLLQYDQLMNREDADAAQLLQQVFVREGIHLILAAKPLQVLKTEGGKLVRYESAGQPGEIEVTNPGRGRPGPQRGEFGPGRGRGPGTIPGRGWWSMIGSKPPTAAFMPPATSA